MSAVLDGIDVVVHAQAQVGEGPVWDPRTQRLVWVDLTEGTLFESDLHSGSTTAIDVGRPLGAAVPRHDEPGFAVAAAEGFGFVVDGHMSLLDSPLKGPFRMNDAKCDAHGRLWAGSTHIDFAPSEGALHRWDNSGPSLRIAEGFTLPNGLGWDASNTVMYLADSMRHVMLRAPYDLDDGTVGSFELAFTVEGGLPDGLAVDVDGCIWVAVWGGGEVRRYQPDGTIDTVIPTPVTQPSSCAFGPEGTLYVTSARAGVPAEPLAGSVFAVDTHTSGVEIASFAS